MPDADRPGTLISFTTAPGPIGHLLRTAIDAEQVGATRLQLSADQPDLPSAVSALREHTGLVITCDQALPGIDVILSAFVEAVVADSDDPPALVAEVAALVAAHPAGVGIAGRGRSVLPALLATLAAGGHVMVEPPDASVRDHAAAVARASGLARIAGRAPLGRDAARTLLGLR